MKKLCERSIALLVSMVVLCLQAGVANCEEVDLSYLWDMASTRIGETLSPLQKNVERQMVQKQFQAPLKQEMQAPSKLELQAPQKLVAAEKLGLCSLIPGRARRLARREDRLVRQEAALELRAGRRLLEPTAGSQGRTVLEGAACSSCSTPTAIPKQPASSEMLLTSLTTRELLESGSIPQTSGSRIVQEPGVCGGSGNGGGRRGLFGRR